MSARRTAQPCPGCGAKNCYRKVSEVCSDCTSALAAWKSHQAEVRRLNERGEQVIVKLSEATHGWPGFYFGGPAAHLPDFSHLRDEMQVLMHHLSHRLTAKLPSQFQGTHKAERLFDRPNLDFPMSEASSGWYNVAALIYPEDLKLLRSLWTTIALFAQSSYLGGLEDGRNLLVQLATGAISPQKFAEQDMKIAKAIQSSGRKQDGILCPVCGKNKVRKDGQICTSCRRD